MPWGIAGLCSLLALACGHAPAQRVAYSAVVERVEHGEVLPVQVYTLSRGLEPTTRLILRLDPGDATGGPRRLEVLGLGVEGAWAGAREGDRVLFRYAGPLPHNANLPIGQLEDFHLVKPSTR